MNIEYKLKACALILVVCATAAVVGQIDDDDGRIVGGDLTTISEHKYMVQLLYYGWWICGGALVSPTYCVTASHCIDYDPASSFSIRAGSTYLNGKGPVRQVAKLWMHPRYNPRTFTYDIAVLKLKGPVSGPNIQPIELPTVKLESERTVTVVGWGDTTEGGNPSKRLRAVKLKVKGYKKCQAAYPGEISHTMICATNPGKDSCQGDSGGPLVEGNVLYGIVSWGYGCARPNLPGVYTNVFRLRSFVNSKING